MDPNPFASAAERSIPEPRVDWSSLPRVAVVAVPVTVLASVPEIWLTQQVVGLPVLGTVASLIALLLAASGIAAFLGRRPRAALWPACLAFPLFLWSIDLQEPEEEDGEPVRDPLVFINPEILETSDTTRPYQEGCLSVPDQYAEVLRPDRVRARWRDRDGKRREE